MNINLDLNETIEVPGQIVGYARVSSQGQNLERQLDALRTAGCTKIFEEKISGQSRNREQLQLAIEYLREGDLLICHSMDRLARSLGDLYSLVAELTNRGVRVRFLKEGQEYGLDSSPVAQLMLGLLGAVAEFERALIRERQSEGIAKAKQRGVYKGRVKMLSPSNVADLRALASTGVSKSELARKFGVSRATIYRYLNSSPAL